jgi:hypothetical protein
MNEKDWNLNFRFHKGEDHAPQQFGEDPKHLEFEFALKDFEFLTQLRESMNNHAEEFVRTHLLIVFGVITFLSINPSWIYLSKLMCILLAFVWTSGLLIFIYVIDRNLKCVFYTKKINLIRSKFISLFPDLSSYDKLPATTGSPDYKKYTPKHMIENYTGSTIIFSIITTSFGFFVFYVIDGIRSFSPNLNAFLIMDYNVYFEIGTCILFAIISVICLYFWTRNYICQFQKNHQDES